MSCLKILPINCASHKFYTTSYIREIWQFRKLYPQVFYLDLLIRGNKMNTYTSTELSLRNGIHMPDIWVAYKGKIYDVSSSKLFKGGKHYRHSAGMDLTKEMEDAPHIDEVFGKFSQVGILVSE